MRLRYAALSDVGRVRKDNQDSGYAGPHLLVIADGVGGSARGDIASSATVEMLRKLDVPPQDGNPEDMLGALAGAIHRSHDRIAQLVREFPDIEGTSSTVTAAIFDGTLIGVGARRRQPRLPPARGRALPADHRPHLRAEPDRRGPDHRGGGAGPSPPQPDPPRGRRGPRAGARRVHARGCPGRPVAAVLRRLLRVAGRRRPPRDPGHGHPRGGGCRARRLRPGRREHRQRHGRRGRPRRGRRRGRTSGPARGRRRDRVAQAAPAEHSCRAQRRHR